MITIPLTQAQFDAASARLKDAGVDVAGTSGQIKHGGAVVGWKYDGFYLTANVLRRPPFSSLDFIEDGIRAWFAVNEVPALAQPAQS